MTATRDAIERKLKADLTGHYSAFRAAKADFAAQTAYLEARYADDRGALVVAKANDPIRDEAYGRGAWARDEAMLTRLALNGLALERMADAVARLADALEPSTVAGRRAS